MLGGLHCYVSFSLAVTSGSCSLVAVPGLHIVVASVVEHRIELMCPALAGRFFTTEPPGKLVTQLLIKTFEYLYIYIYIYISLCIYIPLYIYIYGEEI